jgi:DNA-binding MarR family transcriptional regulator
MMMMAVSSIYGQAGVEFRSLFHTYNACMQRMLSKYGLYPGQPQMLFAIRQMQTPTQNELAQELNVSKASAGVSLRRLEAAGFVKRVRDKKDTRCVRITLTPKGQEYARWCDIDFELIFTTLLEDFTPDGRDQAISTVQRMNKSLTLLRERLES